MKNKGLIFIIFILSVSFLACESKKDTLSDLAEADIAINSFDYTSAEKILDKILKNEVDSKIRYEAYVKLIDISKSIYPDERWTIGYLESMADEFTTKDELDYVLNNLAIEYERIGNTEKANAAYFRLIELSQDDGETANYYKKLSRNYLLDGNFDLAEDMANSCNNLAKDFNEMAECSYTLVQIYYISNNAEKAVEIADILYENPNTAPDIKIGSAQILADTYEVQRKYKEALAIYQNIIDIHPNKKLVELRIQNLESLMKK